MTKFEKQKKNKRHRHEKPKLNNRLIKELSFFI